MQFFFQPADIVTQILNFGSPAPIDVAIDRAQHQRELRRRCRFADADAHVPGAVDVHVQQAFDVPTLHMDIDRTRVAIRRPAGAGRRPESSGLAQLSFQTAPTFWLDPKNGVSYNVAVQTPQYRVTRYQALQNTPVTSASPGSPAANSRQPRDDARRRQRRPS